MRVLPTRGQVVLPACGQTVNNSLALRVLGVSEIEQDGDDVLWAAIAVRVCQVLSGFFGPFGAPPLAEIITSIINKLLIWTG
jgi:hypothetical protein